MKISKKLSGLILIGAIGIVLAVYSIVIKNPPANEDITSAAIAAKKEAEVSVPPMTQCIYVAQHLKPTIKVFNPRGTLLKEWTGVVKPAGIDINSAGDVYVVDWFDDKVKVFTSSGTPITAWTIPHPNGIGISPNGDVYITSFVTDSVHKYSSTGTPLWTMGGHGTFHWPMGIDFNPVNGDMYLVDSLNSLVRQYSPSGILLNQSGYVYQPMGVGVSPSGNVYVFGFNPQVYQFNSSGALITSWLNYVTDDIDIAANGTVWTSSARSPGDNSIKQHTSSGTLINQWGSFSTNPFIALGKCPG